MNKNQGVGLKIIFILIITSMSLPDMAQEKFMRIAFKNGTASSYQLDAIDSLCIETGNQSTSDEQWTGSSLPAMFSNGYIGGEKATQKRIRVATKGLANPERGFRFEMVVGQEIEGATESCWPFNDYRDDGVVITQAYCYLKDYWNRQISQSKLDALQASFDHARREGVKFILRFAYQDDYNQTACPSLARIIMHIRQLEDIIRKNIDVIYTLQIGWIGMWGEFHSDPLKLDQDPYAIASVVKATLKILPENRSTMMRCMRYRTKAKDNKAEIDLNRVGFFNDGTLAGTTDGGTFSLAYDGDPEFDMVTKESAHIPIEGELFWNSNIDLLSANALTAITRFIKHHYSTFSIVHSNSELDWTPVYGSIDAWKNTPFTAGLLKAQGLPCDEKYFVRNPVPSAYEYIRDHFGYRLEAVSTQGEFVGKEYNGKIIVRNVGFSRPVNPRPTYLVLYNDEGIAYEFPTGIDAQFFEPWKEVEVALVGRLPDNAPNGIYHAALWLPDEEETIRYRPEYAITIAEGTQCEILDGRVLNRVK